MATLELIKGLQQLAEREARGENPAVVHSQLLDGIQKLQASVTTPAEKLFRMRFDVCQTVCVRLAQQHGILQSLSKDGRATAAGISTATGADELLIGTFLLRSRSKGDLAETFFSTNHEAPRHHRSCRGAWAAAVRSQSCNSLLRKPRHSWWLQILVSLELAQNPLSNASLTCWGKQAPIS